MGNNINNSGNNVWDAIIVVALAAAFLGYSYLRSRERQRRLDILHQERLQAMEKDIPLPELPIDPLVVKTAGPPDASVGMLIGAVLLAFGLGSMLMLYLLPGFRSLWPAPLPIAFIGGGLLIAFATFVRSGRGY
jgi:hypothetical protein